MILQQSTVTPSLFSVYGTNYEPALHYQTSQRQQRGYTTPNSIQHPPDLRLHWRCQTQVPGGLWCVQMPPIGDVCYIKRVAVKHELSLRI